MTPGTRNDLPRKKPVRTESSPRLPGQEHRPSPAGPCLCGPGDINNRVAGKSERAGRQQDVTGSAGEFEVAGDHGDDYSLGAAAVE